MTDKRIFLYDCTLRDGAQTQGVDFSVADKVAIAQELDRLGIDYVEGGWPGANPTDDTFFASPPPLEHARLSAFGMTRRAGRSAANDPGLATLLGNAAPAVTVVGKTWDFQVGVALGVDLDENVRMISESIAHAVGRAKEVLFDAEHFFDGFKANPQYALRTVRAAYDAGARWVVLCDTNGGTVPEGIRKAVGAVIEAGVPGANIGIHCHNDAELAVANSLAAVEAGARQIQGTLNGLGERCGNANLTSLIPNLMLKLGYETGVGDRLNRLVHVSRVLDERLNRAPSRNAPYVGEAAFAHKGGLHVSAVERDPRCYEHVPPEAIGNRRHIVVSNQAGRSNIMASLRDFGIDVDDRDPKVSRLLEDVKQREHDGYAYDGAEASLELFVRRAFGQVPSYFALDTYRVIVRRAVNGNGPKPGNGGKGSGDAVAEATVKGSVGTDKLMEVAEGNGPVNALDAALRKLLRAYTPHLHDLRLVDYKVRIFTPQAASDGTDAVTRVMVESVDGQGRRWATVGVSSNVVDASFDALIDSITYKLMRDGVAPV